MEDTSRCHWPIAKVSINYCIYQGEGLFPPAVLNWADFLRHIIKKSGCGYWFRIGTSISTSHMGDIKLHPKCERDVDSLIHTTRIYSNIIRMLLGRDKCNWMKSKRGKMITTEEAELQEGNIADVHDSYIGIL